MMENQMNIETVLSGLRNEIKGLRTELVAMKGILAQQNTVAEIEVPKIIIDGHTAALNSSKTECLDEKIFNILLSFQIPMNIKGYTYLKDAIKMAYYDFQITSMMTKGLYPELAKKYNDTPNRVERAMRHAVEIAWYRADDANFIKLNKHLKERPTNSEFIALVAEKLRLEDQKESA